MNCSQARAQLPALLYGDLPHEEAGQVQAHLTSCAACRREAEALQQVRHALDTLPVPALHQDLPGLYREAAVREKQRRRRWRRAAVLLAVASAAALVFVWRSSWELRLERHQVVLSWGSPPGMDVSPRPTPAFPFAEHASGGTPAGPGEVEDRLRLLTDVVQAMATDAELREARRQQEVAALQDEVRSLEQQMAAMPTEQSTTVLDTVLSPQSPKGAWP
jgi:hypothetical protein